MALLHLTVALVGTAAWTAKAGYSLPHAVAKSNYAPEFATGMFQAGEESTKMLLEDAWVDTSITAATPSLCKSLNECGWNRSITAYADILGSKRLLLSGDASYEEDDILLEQLQKEREQLKQLQQLQVLAAQANAEERLAQEAHAVRLSLLLGQSCTESGPRQCWRGATQSSKGDDDTTAPKELRPISITFGEPHRSRSGRADLSPTRTPLITSLRHFKLPSA